jgi:hypothetical protein
VDGCEGENAGGNEVKRTLFVIVAIFCVSGFLFAQENERINVTYVASADISNADGNTTAGEAKTARTEQQVPGVTTEFKDDGTKVVTINLSEIDESKLPEKYVPAVILEVPIIASSKADPNTRTTPPGTLQASEAGWMCDYDLKINKDKIYILDQCNSRILKFDLKGKFERTIPVKNAYTKKENSKIYDDKNEIQVVGDKIYVRNINKNKIETLDETGNVMETTDIPEKIGGRSTAEMKMFADEKGVLIGKTRIKTKEIINTSDGAIIENDINLVQINAKQFDIQSNGKKTTLIQNSPSAVGIRLLFVDKDKNSYYESLGMNGVDRGIIQSY